MNEAVVFASMCPVCKCEQVQYRFNVIALHGLLRGGHPIEAYCETCDEFWPVSAQQRVELGEVVAFWRNLATTQAAELPTTVPLQN